jgi:hypothetical protein
VNRSTIIALSLDMQVKVAIFPKGKDPADIIQEDYKKWEEIIKNKTDIISFHLSKICESTKDRESIRKQIIEKIFPYLKILSSSIKKSNYIKEIYDKTGIPESAITEDYIKYEKTQSANDYSIKDKQDDIKDKKSRRDGLEKKLFGIIFWKGENKEQSDQIEALRLSFEESIGSDKFKSLFDIYNINADNLSLEAEMWYGDKIDILIKDMKEITLNLEEEILNEQAYSLLLNIKDKERSHEKKDINNDLVAYQKIVEKIEDIKIHRSK